MYVQLSIWLRGYLSMQEIQVYYSAHEKDSILCHLKTPCGSEIYESRFYLLGM